MKIIFQILITFLILGNSLAFAKSDEVLRTQKIVASWEAWLKMHDVTKAAIAVSFKGKTMAELGIGREVTDPAPVASISKSITGICIAKLVEAGKINFDAPLNSIIQSLNSDVSIASLLKQTSGFTHDMTQRPDKFKGRDKEYLEWMSRKEISKGRDDNQIGKFNYNNSNYAMLGTVIRHITDKSYENACKEIVFEPIGISNVFLNPEWRVMSSWGGWMISAKDHLKFINAYYGEDKVLGQKAKDFPYHRFDEQLNYGMGYMFRSGRNGGTNFWHDGKWHVDLDNKKYRYGAFFVSFDNGWAITMNHNISAINGEHAEIDRLIGEATHLPL